MRLAGHSAYSFQNYADFGSIAKSFQMSKLLQVPLFWLHCSKGIRPYPCTILIPYSLPTLDCAVSLELVQKHARRCLTLRFCGFLWCEAFAAQILNRRFPIYQCVCLCTTGWRPGRVRRPCTRRQMRISGAWTKQAFFRPAMRVDLRYLCSMKFPQAHRSQLFLTMNF